MDDAPPLPFSQRLFGRMLRCAEKLASDLRCARARWRGAVIGRDCRLANEVRLENTLAHPWARGVRLGERCDLHQGAVLNSWGGSIHVGTNVFIGPYVVIYGHGGVSIGDDTLISMHCRILSSNHTIPAPGTAIRSQPDIPAPTVIGRNVWLGAGVTVLAGVTIGDGCVVGAGAVVTKDLPAYGIAFGVPARVMTERK